MKLHADFCKNLRESKHYNSKIHTQNPFPFIFQNAMSLMLWMITFSTRIHTSTCEVLAYKHFDYKLIYIEYFFGCLKITWIWQEAIPKKISISYEASKSLSQYQQMKNGEKVKNKYRFHMSLFICTATKRKRGEKP